MHNYLRRLIGASDMVELVGICSKGDDENTSLVNNVKYTHRRAYICLNLTGVCISMLKVSKINCLSELWDVL